MDDVLKARRIAPRNNDEKQWFVSSELLDLDLDPQGLKPDVLSALDEISSYLANLDVEDPEP